ncbi:MAG: methyltransferase domain-containing protein [Thermoplasmata archaeon]|nr:methyltransferase domain-containing protein [Thermoplasmata archaeon]
MRAVDRSRMRANLGKWDESVPHHVASRLYQVPAFRRGRDTLNSIEVAAVGPVRGLSLLHLQCHFGLDTLSWARRGAKVTGVDFSPTAVVTARTLAQETGIPARFVESNIYDLPKRLKGSFDVVYTAKGALCWLPDLDAWGRVVAHFLKPGGRFFVLDDHSAADIYRNERETRAWELEGSYFSREPFREESDGTYAVAHAPFKNKVSYSWVHPVSEVITALLRAGLVLEEFREFPYSYWKKFSFMRKGADGYYHLTLEEGRAPLMFSVTAVRPGGRMRAGRR